MRRQDLTAWWCLGVPCSKSSRCAGPETSRATACVLGSSQLQRGGKGGACCLRTYGLTSSPLYWLHVFLTLLRCFCDTFHRRVDAVLSSLRQDQETAQWEIK